MINLEKGQRISMEKTLHKVGVGLGWDPNANGGENFDLDASAFMLGKNKKTPADKFFVFYNNPVSQDGAVSSSGDDRTGGNSADGDDETLTGSFHRGDRLHRKHLRGGETEAELRTGKERLHPHLQRRDERGDRTL